MRPASSTPPVTGEAWDVPSVRSVMRTIRCRGRDEFQQRIAIDARVSGNLASHGSPFLSGRRAVSTSCRRCLPRPRRRAPSPPPCGKPVEGIKLLARRREAVAAEGFTCEGCTHRASQKIADPASMVATPRTWRRRVLQTLNRPNACPGMVLDRRGYAMSTSDFPGVRWHGHWVAPDVPEFVIDPTSVGSDLPPAGFSRSLFRRVFDLQEVPARVPLRVSADRGTCCGSTVSRLVGVRSARSRGGSATTSTTSRGMCGPAQRRGRAGDVLRPPELVLATGGVQRGHGSRRTACAGGSAWHAMVGHRRAVAGAAVAGMAGAGGRAGAGWRPVELLDARELDPFWMEPDFDDSAWVDATVLKASHDGALAESRPPIDPYGAMLPRGIEISAGPGLGAVDDGADRTGRGGSAGPSRRPARPTTPQRRDNARHSSR